VYEPGGRRISKTVDGTTTYFLWSGRQLIAEYDATGNRTQRYSYLPNRFAPSQMTDANGTYQVHTDHLDTPKLLTDATETIVWRSVREAFGEMTPDENPDGDANSITLNIRFPGQYYDLESDTHYNYFRDYDPALGRYVQADPIGLRGGLNIYSYVENNPARYLDPNGLKICAWLDDSCFESCIEPVEDEYSYCDSLIVDVRCSGGGSSSSVCRYCEGGEGYSIFTCFVKCFKIKKVSECEDCPK